MAVLYESGWRVLLQGATGPYGLAQLEAMREAGTRLLTRFGCGQSAITHMGGDMVVGRNPHEYLARFLDDPETDIVAYLGEIGGGKEYAMLDLIAARRKPVVALIVGRHAPPGKQMGHAGALVEGTRETATAKRAALAEAGAVIADNPEHLAQCVAEMLVPA